jgi:hypothetical protein
MLMVAFDNNGKYITNAIIILQSNCVGLYLSTVSDKGRIPSDGLWTSKDRLLEKQQELGFRIINRSGQCLSFLGEDT